MSVETNHSDLYEESTENDLRTDDGSKLSSFLYVDINDYNENTLDGIDIKKEEEQVEYLTIEENHSKIADSYFEENLTLNFPKSLAEYSENDFRLMKMPTAQKIIKNQPLKKESQNKINSLKTKVNSRHEENVQPKKYALRATTVSKRMNLDLPENVSEERRNMELHNKAKTASCSKFKVICAEADITQNGDIVNRNFLCLYCGTCFGHSCLWHEHITICKSRNSRSDIDSGLNCENYITHSNHLISERDSEDHKGILCICGKHKRTKKKCDLDFPILQSACNIEKYTCALCDKTFLKKNILKKHIQAHLSNKTHFQWCHQINSKAVEDVNYEEDYHICSKYEKTFLKTCSENTQSKDKCGKCFQNGESLAFEKYADSQSSDVSFSTISNLQTCQENFKLIKSFEKHPSNNVTANSRNAKDDTSIARHVSASARTCQKSSSSRKQNTYKCNECGKSFAKLVKLKIHILNGHQRVNYQCEKCGTKFPSKDELNTHKTKDCKREDLCTCTTCGKVFAKRDYLKKHQYMHMNVLFKCKYCYCAFMKEKSYKKHIKKMNCSKSARKIRMAEFNYKKCRLCEAEYDSEELLIDHFKNSHAGLEPHQCFCCDSCLPTFQELQNHIHQHNIQKYTCNLCGKPYTSQEGFRKHRLKHKGAEFKCRFCESEFLNENRFKFHEKTCKKNPESGRDPSQAAEKSKKKDAKPKQSRQLHWESRIIMKRLRGDPNQKYLDGQRENSLASTFFDEPEIETNERGWFDNYYKTEEDDIAFGLKKADEPTAQDWNSDPNTADGLQKGSAKKKKANSPTIPNTDNSEVAEDREDTSDRSSENSSTDSDEEIMNTDFPFDYNPKKCRLCFISFGQEYELLHHFIKSHPGKHAHKCPHCGVKSPLYAQLKEHMKTHGIGIGIFNCDNCSKQFKSEKKMSSHNIRCKGIDNDKGMLEKETVAQAGDDSCKRCGKKFHTKFGYRRHKQLCKKKKTKNSEKPTAGPTKLGSNEGTISNKIPSGCDFPCLGSEEDIPKPTKRTDASENTSSAAPNSKKPAENSSAVATKPPEKEKQEEGPKSTYAGEPPMDSFPCRLCDKKFQYERGIVMHFKKAHPGNKPLICHVCNMHLADKLKEHLKTHGIGEEFICELCGKRFNQKFLSKIHEIWHQGIEYKCNNCKQKFLNRDKMNKHIAENRCQNRQSLMRLPCDICGKFYRSKFGLTKHYLTHTPKELRPVKNRMNCEYCGKWFENNNGLQRHRRIHTGERPFCCRFCPKAFAQEGNCKAHERIHTGESKPRKRKLTPAEPPPIQTLVPDPPPIPHPPAAAAPFFSLSAPAVEPVHYSEHINSYDYHNPGKIVP